MSGGPPGTLLRGPKTTQGYETEGLFKVLVLNIPQAFYSQIIIHDKGVPNEFFAVLKDFSRSPC